MEEYTLLRSRRKTLALRVLEGGRLEVRAPLQLSRAQIDSFLTGKAEWIMQQRKRLSALEHSRQEFSPQIGRSAPYLGQEYPILSGEVPRFDGTAFYLRPDQAPIPQLVTLYRSLARAELTRRVDAFARQMSLAPTGIKITSAKTRYGSCSAKNGLCFTWRLILAPPEAVDYVAVHELCHIRQHNHSSRFWAEVERVLPDYRQREQTLRTFGLKLAGQNWDKLP